MTETVVTFPKPAKPDPFFYPDIEMDGALLTAIGGVQNLAHAMQASTKALARDWRSLARDRFLSVIGALNAIDAAEGPMGGA